MTLLLSTVQGIFLIIFKAFLTGYGLGWGFAFAYDHHKKATAWWNQQKIIRQHKANASDMSGEYKGSWLGNLHQTLVISGF